MSTLARCLLYHSRNLFSTQTSNIGTKSTKSLVIALGGNAIKKPSDKGTSDEMLASVEHATHHIMQIVKTNPDYNYKICVTHGNGPQVGSLYLQNQMCNSTIPALPLTFCGAMTQGYIGYMLQQSFRNNIKSDPFLQNIFKGSVTMVNQVGISKHDKAFANPTKPIGKFYTEEEAKILAKEKNYHMVEDSGRGWRITVGSPKPIQIMELDAIKQLLDDEYVVIAAGGGGIPVVIDDEDSPNLYGMDAVIDKDKTSVLLANVLDADTLVIATDGDGIWLNYNDKENRKKLDVVQVDELKQYYNDGMWNTFGGSMKPKIEAVIEFVEKTGGEAIICDLKYIDQAVVGKAGTTIYQNELKKRLVV